MDLGVVHVFDGKPHHFGMDLEAAIKSAASATSPKGSGSRDLGRSRRRDQVGCTRSRLDHGLQIPCVALVSPPPILFRLCNIDMYLRARRIAIIASLMRVACILLQPGIDFQFNSQTRFARGL